MDRFTTLKAFCRLMELESFSAVAQELRVKQSTVSKWIAALEEELGVRLVDRTTRSLRATEAGQRFYRRAASIVPDYEAAVGEAREATAELRGPIRMSVPVVFGQRFIVPAVTRFLLLHESIELELIFGDRYVSLVEERFDLAIRVGVPVDSALSSHSLAEGRRYLVASPAYLERCGAPEDPSGLERHQCLVPHGHGQRGDQNPPGAWSFRRGKKVYRVRVGGRVCTNHSEATLHLARAGMGVALLASWLVEPDILQGALVALLPDFEPPSAPVRGLTPPGRFLTPRVRALIEHLRRELAPALASNHKPDDPSRSFGSPA